ncbi:MAG: phenylalanine--tRNA ligase subunit alpha, partial [Actinomycetota bacterium]
MIDHVTKHEQAAITAIDAAETVEDLQATKTAVLGKAAPLAQAQRELGSLPPDERKDAGRVLNQARKAVEARLDVRLSELASAERATQLVAERLDLTEVPTQASVGHAHVVTQAWEELEDVFVGMGFRIAEGPEVETDWHNFDALNIPPGHPARDVESIEVVP